ncbi:hypothetical protein MMC20_006946 [Loxospora ochrophaea]|nr:hypothetical protein [Loxospora ochrophaea]
MSSGDGCKVGSLSSSPGPTTAPADTGLARLDSREGCRYNTIDLPWRIASDAAAAASASTLVAPLITIIDRGIIENASSRSTLRASITASLTGLFTRPHVFLASTPFRLITTLYFGTYLTANTIDTISSTLTPSSPSTTTSGPAKFLATTSVNMSLCVYKDSRFVRLFGPLTSSGPGRPVPKASFALFAIRDSLTILASFNLPPKLAPLLPVSKSFERHMSRASAAQFLAPAVIQLASTPLHLWGLDLYNRPGMSWRERVTRVQRDWLISSIARMARIVPAFGVGGVVNNRVRLNLMRRCDTLAQS